MATPINTLKNWFKTGLKPTQSQFWAWIDSFRHKDELVPAADIDGLNTLLDGKLSKPAESTPGNVPVFGADGQLVDSGSGPGGETPYLGTYLTLAALELAHPTADPGSYAIVDAGVGTDAIKYIWDESDAAWIAGGGAGGLTPQQEADLAAAAVHIDNADEPKHTSNQIIEQAANILLGLPENSKMNAVIAAITSFLAGTINTNAINDPSWLESEQRLAVLIKQSGEINMGGAALLLELFGPPDNATALNNASGWSADETKTITGDNSLGQLGQKGQRIWLNYGTFADCTDAVVAVNGSAVYKRNRSIDVMDPVSNTQDAAIINQLDPSYTYPAMTPTGVSSDSGWNTSTNVKAIANLPAKWGMWFIGGLNGDGWHYECFLVVGTTSYWKRLGAPESFQRAITVGSHPTLVGRLLAHDFTVSTYTPISGDEPSYPDQTYWHAASRRKFEMQLDGTWDEIYKR